MNASGSPLPNELRALRAERDALLLERDAARGGLAEWAEWSNEVAELLPEQYDGEESQEAIILRAVADLVARAEAAEARIAAARSDLAFALMGDPGHPPAIAALEQAIATLGESTTEADCDCFAPVNTPNGVIEGYACEQHRDEDHDGSTTEADR